MVHNLSSSLIWTLQFPEVQYGAPQQLERCSLLSSTIIVYKTQEPQLYIQLDLLAKCSVSIGK